MRHEERGHRGLVLALAAASSDDARLLKVFKSPGQKADPQDDDDWLTTDDGDWPE